MDQRMSESEEASTDNVVLKKWKDEFDSDGISITEMFKTHNTSLTYKFVKCVNLSPKLKGQTLQ